MLVSELSIQIRLCYSVQFTDIGQKKESPSRPTDLVNT